MGGGDAASRMATGTLQRHRFPLQLCLSHPWFTLHIGQAGVTGRGSHLTGRAVGDTVPTTRTSALPVLVGSCSHT